ncbi:MAG: SH3 domain-containing protein [Defluviitaleaceae bacterium]|nr:SH3 domain-containing protein [Defluviitaleaceae bacterium]
MKKSKILGLIITTVAAVFVTFATTAIADNYEGGNSTYVIEETEEIRNQFITTDNLRLRSGPSTAHDIITTLSAGTRVEVSDMGCNNEFTHITAGELSGYVARRYIRQPTAASIPTGEIELTPWNEVRSIISTGTLIQVYDIGSGLTYTVRVMSAGNHADVETLTQTNTNTLRQTSGVWSWDPRPVLVTINGRTIAAAINTMPHAGSTIRDNGLNGHICLHFSGSRTHNGNQSYVNMMQRAVQQAANHR